MPALTAWFFAIGGAGLAAHRFSVVPDVPPQTVRVGVGLLVRIAAVTPGLVLASQRQIDAATDALRAADCTRAIDRASAAINTLEVRPEPYRVIALCQSQRGNDRFALQAMEKAASRDPNNWSSAYDLAVLRGGAGLD